MTLDFIEIIRTFPSLRILVAGDMLLDHYITGATDRTSPEAPVPVVLVNGEHFHAGGAANVARNVAGAGADAIMSGMIGRDAAANTIIDELTVAGIDTSTVLQSNENSTIIKMRIVSQGQQIVRLDHEKPLVPTAQDVAAINRSIDESLPRADAVILSDYGKGFLSDEILRQIIDGSVAQGIPVFVDPKGRDYSRYRGAFAITPNSREAQEATGISTSTEDGLRRAAKAIREITQCRIVAITRGADGLALLDEDGELCLVPTFAREIFDVTGAGDTFIAWLTLGIATKLTSRDAAHLANTAAGIAVGRSGPAVVRPLEVRQALAPGRLGKKIISEKALERLGEDLRSNGKKIVLTNGCFDFLHAGHVAFLQQAKSYGDVLVLAMNTDESIRRLKGNRRPVIAQKQREELMASIEAVDFVTVFSEDTPHEIIKKLRPDVLVKASNYTMEEVEGADLIKSQGGAVEIVRIEHDISTSRLIDGAGIDCK